MSRTPLIAGNWKSNLNHVEATGLVQKLAWTLQDRNWDRDKSEVVVFPPFTDLRTVQTLIDGDKLKLGLGAQDVSTHDGGAHTGEVSARMLAKLGCTYVIVGHSERRAAFAETDEIVQSKVIRALAADLSPIVCVGEDAAVREDGGQIGHVLSQVAGALSNLNPEDVSRSVIAYEPIWAIGSGKAATPEDAQEIAAAVREFLAEEYGIGVSEQVRVLYGGSVTSAQVVSLMAQPDVDGCLAGGASLKVDEFAAIARFYDLVGS